MNEIHKLESNSPQQPSTNDEIPNTPFRLIHLEPHGWWIAIGMNRVSKLHKTKAQALKNIKNPSWIFTCNVTVTLIQQINELTKPTKTNT